MGDPLRTGAIFKLDLSKVRSPPVVKFAVPDVPKPQPVQLNTSSAKKDPIKEAFNEIYRRTPVPAILLSSSKSRSSGSSGSSQQRQWDRSEIPSSFARLMNNGDTLQDTDEECDPTHGANIGEAVKQTVTAQHGLQKRKSVEPVDTDENVVLPAEVIPQRSKADSNSSSKKLSTTTISHRNIEQMPNSGASSHHSDRRSTERHFSPTRLPIQNRSDSHQPISQPTAEPLARSVSAPSRGSSRTRGGGDSLLMLASAPSVSVKSALPRDEAITSQVPAKLRIASQQWTYLQSAGEERKSESVLIRSNAVAPAAARDTNTSKNMSAPANQQSKKSARAGADTSEESGTDAVSQPAVRRRGRPPGSHNRKPSSSPTPTATAAVAAAAAPGTKSDAKAATTKAMAGMKRKAQQQEAQQRRLSQTEADSSGPSSAEEDASDEQHSGSERKRQASKGKSNGRNSSIGGSGAGKGEAAIDLGDGAEKDATVTRSGRTSIPKKVIPTIGETDEPKTKGKGRGRPRLSGSPTKAPKPSTGTATGATRQPVQAKKAAAAQKSTARGNGKAQEGQVEQPAPGSTWLPREIIALYSVQNRVDVTAPDFWDIVSDDLAEMDVFRTAEECQQRWFETVREAEERKRVNAERKRLKEAQPSAAARTGGSQQAPQHTLIDASRSLLRSIDQPHAAAEKEAPSTGNAAAINGKPTEPAKNKRIGKAEMKKLAAESLKATRDDDIFESGEMQNYFNPVLPEQDALLDLLDSLDLPGEGELLPAFGESVPSSSAVTAGADGGSEDAGPMFASSHVHKLHYKPQFKVPRAATTGAGHSQSGHSSNTDRAPNMSGMTKAGMARMMKNGVVNAELVKKQARADLGVQEAGSGSDGEESEGEGSSDDDSQD